jgi:predicted PurR-regulated permease PerM
MFFFFRDGDKLVERMRELLPMSADLKQNVTGCLKEVIHATIYGGVLVAGLTGLIGGIIFHILGLPSPIFWGTLMAFLSLIPVVGPYLIYIPAAIILILSGHWIKGVILLALGALVINVTEGMLRPVLISSRTRIPTLALFFSILGGIRAFGLLGIILGPVLAAIALTLIEVYKPRAGQSSCGPEAEAS